MTKNVLKGSTVLVATLLATAWVSSNEQLPLVDHIRRTAQRLRG